MKSRQGFSGLKDTQVPKNTSVGGAISDILSCEIDDSFGWYIIRPIRFRMGMIKMLIKQILLTCDLKMGENHLSITYRWI